MRIHFLAAPAFPYPTSRGTIKLRFHGFDFVWAVISPVLAFYLSDANRLNAGQIEKTILLYSSVALVASVIALLIFKVHEGVERYFSVYDALAVGKAVVVAELVTCVVLFNVMRLEGIPRSMPIIHALILGAGIVFARMATRTSAIAQHPPHNGGAIREHILMIGANSLSVLYIKFLQLSPSPSHDVIALLDSRKEMFGRAIEGVRVVGAPEHLESLIAEYTVHGIEIGRILVAGEPKSLSPEQLNEIMTICEKRQIFLDFMPQMRGLREFHPGAAEPVVETFLCKPVTPSVYFRWKRGGDFLVALLMIIVLMPILLGVSLCVLVDLGAPVLFWQLRLGINGSRFLLYKFRTLRPPFDWRGNPIPADKRLSKVGRILRDTSLDELPQLLNILVGNMSLIGPRPLLPEDQPANPTVRLMVRPGITGWAQVNGGKHLTPSEKDQLDECYVKNANFWVDLKVALYTAKILFMRRRSGESAADLREIASRNMGARKI